MGGPARPLHEPGNHRSSERSSHRHSADCGSLIERPTLLRLTAPTPRPGARSFRDYIGFWTALGASWLLVLPEYVLNVAATRFGYGTYSGAQMASLHLAFGVVCVALVSHFFLDERISVLQTLGFVLLAVAILLITYR